MAASTLAPAKVNLFLHVGAPQPDGYHPVCSLMAFADVGDRLELAPAAELSLKVEGEFAGALAGEGDNLVLRAARALLARAGRAVGARIVLDKRLPVASGLGGGSADAGAALRLLRRELAPELDDDALQAIAAQLGADGPACLWARPAIGTGRGDQLEWAPALPTLDAVLVNPRTPVSTPAVYRRFDDLAAFGSVEAPELPQFRSGGELAGWLASQRNDPEAASVAVEPVVGRVLERLRGSPHSRLARVSGSGGTCFALCADPGEAEALAAEIAAAEPGWWVRSCRLGAPALA